jgi:hypothetical protein
MQHPIPYNGFQWPLIKGQNGHRMNITTQLHIVLRIRMHVVSLPRLLHVFMAGCSDTGSILPII